MPLTTFPIPTHVKKYFLGNPFGLPDDLYTAIVITSQNQPQPSIELVEAANIDTDASLGSNFYITLTGNRNMNAPTNPVPWKTIRYYITQDAVGSRTLTWNADFRFSIDFPTPVLTTTPSYSDYVEFLYNPTNNSWDCLRVVEGFVTPP